MSETVLKSRWIIHKDLGDDVNFEPQLQAEKMTAQICALFEERDADGLNSADMAMLRDIAGRFLFGVNDLIKVYSEIWLKGFAQSVDLKRIQVLGFPLYEKLGMDKGVSAEWINKTADDGKITFNVIEGIFLERTMIFT